MSRPETKASSYGSEHDGPLHEGGLSGNGRRFAIVAARFNDFIVEKLIDGARAALRRAGVEPEDIELYRCPGAMEIPGLARKVNDTGKFDGIVCLGAQVLAHLGAKTIRLLTNRPRPIVGLGGYGLEVVECVAIRPPGRVVALHEARKDDESNEKVTS